LDDEATRSQSNGEEDQKVTPASSSNKGKKLNLKLKLEAVTAADITNKMVNSPTTPPASASSISKFWPTRATSSSSSNVPEFDASAESEQHAKTPKSPIANTGGETEKQSKSISVSKLWARKSSAPSYATAVSGDPVVVDQPTSSSQTNHPRSITEVLGFDTVSVSKHQKRKSAADISLDPDRDADGPGSSSSSAGNRFSLWSSIKGAGSSNADHHQSKSHQERGASGLEPASKASDDTKSGLSKAIGWLKSSSPEPSDDPNTKSGIFRTKSSKNAGNPKDQVPLSGSSAHHSNSSKFWSIKSNKSSHSPGNEIAETEAEKRAHEHASLMLEQGSSSNSALSWLKNWKRESLGKDISSLSTLSNDPEERMVEKRSASHKSSSRKSLDLPSHATASMDEKVAGTVSSPIHILKYEGVDRQLPPIPIEGDVSPQLKPVRQKHHPNQRPRNKKPKARQEEQVYIESEADSLSSKNQQKQQGTGRQQQANRNQKSSKHQHQGKHRHNHEPHLLEVQQHQQHHHHHHHEYHRVPQTNHHHHSHQNVNAPTHQKPHPKQQKRQRNPHTKGHHQRLLHLPPEALRRSLRNQPHHHHYNYEPSLDYRSFSTFFPDNDGSDQVEVEYSDFDDDSSYYGGHQFSGNDSHSGLYDFYRQSTSASPSIYSTQSWEDTGIESEYRAYQDSCGSAAGTAYTGLHIFNHHRTSSSSVSISSADLRSSRHHPLSPPGSPLLASNYSPSTGTAQFGDVPHVPPAFPSPTLLTRSLNPPSASYHLSLHGLPNQRSSRSLLHHSASNASFRTASSGGFGGGSSSSGVNAGGVAVNTADTALYSPFFSGLELPMTQQQQQQQVQQQQHVQQQSTPPSSPVIGNRQGSSGSQQSPTAFFTLVNSQRRALQQQSRRDFAAASAGVHENEGFSLFENEVVLSESGRQGSKGSQ
jgi:hypothetical protein